MINLIPTNKNAVVPLVLMSATFLTLFFTKQTSVNDSWSLWAVTLIGIGIGSWFLIKLRPQRFGFSPPNVMLALGFGGMISGLVWDIYQTQIPIIESICSTSGDLSIFESLKFHIALMPGMHIGMIIGGLAAIPSLRLLRPDCRRLCSMLTQNILCSIWMLLGMTFGAILFLQLFQQTSQLQLNFMLGGMFVGMTWGMALSVGLYRTFFLIQDWRCAVVKNS